MTSIGSDRQSEQERGSDAAFVEALHTIAETVSAEIGQRFGQDIGRVVLWRVREKVEAALASRAATIPDAGAEDVVAQALRDEMEDSEWTFHRLARAALAVMPRRDERAGMLRAAEIAKQERELQAGHTAWDEGMRDMTVRLESRCRAEAKKLATSTPEQPRDDGWQPIETAPTGSQPIWVFGGRAEKPIRVLADGEWWAFQRKDYPGDRHFTHWRPDIDPPAPVTK